MIFASSAKTNREVRTAMLAQLTTQLSTQRPQNCWREKNRILPTPLQAPKNIPKNTQDPFCICVCVCV